MTIREIDRQYEHWTIYPPPSIAIARLGASFGIPVPERKSKEPFTPTSIEELEAFAASFGVTDGK